MRIDLNWLGRELATVYADEAATERRHAAATDWQARIHRELQAAGNDAIRNPDRPELLEIATILVGAQYVVIEELIELEARQARQEQAKAQIAELAARVGLTLADLERLEHGHA